MTGSEEFMPEGGGGQGSRPAGRGPLPRRLIIFIASLAGAGALLAIAWRVFYSWREPTFILTALRGAPPVAPVYGFFLPQHTTFGVLLVAAVLTAALYAWSRLPASGTMLFLCLAVMFSAAMRFSVHAARDGTLPGREFLAYPGEDVIYDVPRVESASAFLRDYTRLQPQLSLHGRTKPPGFALMHHAIQRLLGDHVLVIGSLLTAFASLIVLPAYGIGRSLRGRVEDGRACAMLVASAPGSVVFGAVSLDAVYAVVAATAVALTMRELRRPGWRSRMGLGLLLSLAMMLSYSTFVVGLLCGLLLLLDRFRRPAACAGHLLQVLLWFLLPLVGLFVYPGFDAWSSWVNARRLNEAAMSAIVGHGLGGFEVWLYASAGNLLAFLIYLGLPILGAWLLLPIGRLDRPARTFTAGVLLALGVACLGGLYLMETERVLLYLVPPAAAVAVLVDPPRPLGLVALGGVQSVVFEILIHTLW
jgi:hypothetical protein